MLRDRTNCIIWCQFHVLPYR